MSPSRNEVEAWKRGPWSRLPKWAKWILGIVGAVLVIGVIAGSEDDGNDSSEATSTSTSTSTIAARESRPPANLSPSVRIRVLMDEEFGGQLKSVKVSDAFEGGYIVLVVYDEDEDLSASFTEMAIESEMIDAYEALFTEPGLKVREAEIDARIMLVDRFGNESFGAGWETLMTGDVGRRIQWDRSEYLDFEELWDTRYKHRDLD
jgi:hypothetical protein